MVQGRKPKPGPKAGKQNERSAAVVELVPAESVPDPRDWWTADVLGQWPGWWQSDAAGLWRDADRLLVFRLADLLARADLLQQEADLAPIVEGSQGQPIVHPGYRAALALQGEARQLEKELGLTPASRLGLGLAAQSVKQRSLQDLGSSSVVRALPSDPRTAP